MRKILLHLSHTDIRVDSRILKELHALEALVDHEIVALGIELDEGTTASKRVLASRIVTVRLFSGLLRWLPRPVRYLLNMLELTSIFVVRGIALRPAVVHCHDTLVLPAGLLVKIFTRCKLVYDAHELESDKNGQTRLLSKGTLLIEKLAWRWVDLLISVSDSILAWYESNLGPKKSILVLNSPEISELTDPLTKGPKKYFHERFDIAEGKRVFVYLGIFEKGRGIEVALEAFADPSIDAHLVLIGYGALGPHIKSYCDRYPNIHLHDPVPHDQIVALVRNADVGLCLVENVSLSDYLCLPNKLFEYSFAGLHVLASDLPEIRRVVQHYSVGTCCELNADKIREAVRYFVADRPEHVGRNLTELAWNAQAERLVRGYEDLLNLRRMSQDANAE